MTNITDIAFLDFLASKGVAPDDYGGFDGATKLGFIQAFEKHQQPPVQPGNFLHPVNLIVLRIYIAYFKYIPIPITNTKYSIIY